MKTIEQKIEQLNAEVGNTYADTMEEVTIVLTYAHLAHNQPAIDSHFDRLCEHLKLLGQLARDHGQKRLSQCVQVILNHLCGLYS